MKTVYKIGERIADASGAVSCLALVCIMLLTVADVFMRRFFVRPILGTFEMTEYLLMAAVFTGMVLSQKKKMHVKVTFFIDRVPWRARCVIHGIFELICTGMLMYQAYAAFLHARFFYSGAWTSDVLQFPIHPFYWIMAISFFFFALLLFVDSIFYFMGAYKKEAADEVLSWYT